jgi:type IV pilus assembly protein PilP
MSKHVRSINRPRAAAAVGLVLWLTAGAAAQEAAAPPGAAAPAPAAAGSPAGAAPPEAAYSYSPEGRRDPFISLIGRGSEAHPSGSRPVGTPGLLINEVGIKGIVRDRAGFIAMIQGADSRTYVIRAGDRLMDGTVKAILEDAVVFSQDVNDPLSLVKQKEVRKNLRSPEGGRG